MAFWKAIAPYLPTIISGIGALLNPGQVQQVKPKRDRYARELIGRLTQPYQPYPGAMDIALPPMAQQLLTGAPVFQQMPQLWEDYYRSAIEAPARREFEERTLPAMREEFAGMPGTYWAGARAQEMGRARERFGESLAAERAKTALSAEQLAGQRVMGLTPYAMQIASANLANRLQEWRLAQGIDDPRMQLLAQYLAAEPEPIAYYQPSVWSQLLGPAAQITQAWLQSRPVAKDTTDTAQPTTPQPTTPQPPGRDLPADRYPYENTLYLHYLNRFLEKKKPRLFRHWWERPRKEFWER